MSNLSQNKALENLSDLLMRANISSAVRNITKDGYYLSSFFIELFEKKYLLDLLSNWSDIDDKSEFNQKLKDLIDSNVNELEDNIKKSIPKRSQIIASIFSLYKSSHYAGLITLVLSQVDGLMKEITDGKNGFYNAYPSKKKEKPNHLKFLDNEFYFGLFSDGAQLVVEDRNEYELFKKDVEDLTAFNRHAILHGESYEFAHELNAVKSILLLSLIADVYSFNHE